MAQLYEIKKFHTKEIKNLEGKKYILGKTKVIDFDMDRFGIEKKRRKLRTGFKKLKKK